MATTYSALRVGFKLRTVFGNDLDRTYHVRGIVDGRLVLRHWLASKKRWEYSVEGPEWFAAFRSSLIITPPPGSTR